MGAATPISFTRGQSPDFGVFLYLSFEHKFLDDKAAKSMARKLK